MMRAIKHGDVISWLSGVKQRRRALCFDSFMQLASREMAGGFAVLLRRSLETRVA